MSGWPSQEEGRDRKGGFRPLTFPGAPCTYLVAPSIVTLVNTNNTISEVA